jgi:hypothetical protein
MFRPVTRQIVQLLSCHGHVEARVASTDVAFDVDWIQHELSSSSAAAAAAHDADGPGPVGDDGGTTIVHTALEEAVRHGILRPVVDESSTTYRFSCSTCRDVVYSTIPRSERAKLHARLGRYYLQQEQQSNVFVVVAHCQRGLEHLTTDERFQFAKICYRAGDRSAEWSLFEIASQFYAMAIKMLDCLANDNNGGDPTTISPEAKWTSSTDMYDLSIDLYLAIARTCVHQGQFEDADRYCTEVVHHVKNSSSSKESSTKSIVEKARANAIQIQCLVMQKKYVDAIHLGIKTLQKLGESTLHVGTTSGVGSIESMSQTSDADVKAAKKLLDNLLKQSSSNGNNHNNNNTRMIAASVVSMMNPLDDPKGIQSMEIYNLLLAPALMVQGNLISSIAYRMVKVTLTSNGICPVSAVGFIAMSSYLYFTGDNERGSFCERLGNEISSKYQDKACRGRMLVLQNALSLPHQGFSDQLKVR